MIEQNTFTIIFGVFLILTGRDMFFGQSSSETEMRKSAEHLHQSIAGLDPTDGTNLMNPYGVPTIKIQYCHSCGYRQAFEEISKMLMANFPKIEVKGEYHQPSWLRSQIVNLIFITKIAVLGMVYMEFNPFTYFQMATPPLWSHLSQNKVSSTLLILFLANSIESNMLSTGAFEIYFNDNIPVWSKLQTGRMPTGAELINVVTAQMSFIQKNKVGEFVPT